MEENNENDPFEDIEAAAKRATLDLLPRKSRVQYDIAYNKFQKWCEAKGVSEKYTENVFLAYFEEKAKADEAKDLIEEALTSCGAEIDGPRNIGNLVVQEDADEIELGKILFCANKKVGLQYDNGEINLDVLEDLLETGNRDEETAKKILECGRSKGDTAEATAFNFLKCHELAVKSPTDEAHGKEESVEESLKACGAEIEGPNAIRTLVVKEDADEKKLGSILFCANKRNGLQNENGDFNLDLLKHLIEDAKHDEETSKKYMECGKVKGDTGEAKAFNFLKCHETK